MTNLRDPRIVWDSALRAIYRQTKVRYSPWLLGDAQDEPFNLTIVAAFYPMDMHHCYYMIGHDPKLEARRDTYRRQILSFRTSRRAAEAQREMIELRTNMPPDVVEANRQLCAMEADMDNVPLYFITFGLTRANNREMAAIWHPFNMTTVECLEEAQSIIREQFKTEGREL